MRALDVFNPETSIVNNVSVCPLVFYFPAMALKNTQTRPRSLDVGIPESSIKSETLHQLILNIKRRVADSIIRGSTLAGAGISTGKWVLWTM